MNRTHRLRHLALLLALAVCAGTGTRAQEPGVEPVAAPEQPAALPEAPEPAEIAEPGVEEGEAESDLVYKGEQIFTSIHVRPNEVIRGELVCIGCDAIIEGEVTQDIVVVGGSLKLSGTAGHDLVCVLSNVELAEGAEIGHDFVAVLGGLDDRGADVGNQRINVSPFGGLPNLPTAFGALGAVILYGKILKTVLVFVVILILAVFVSDRIRTLSDEFPVSYGLALVAGFGAYVLLLVIVALLCISMIGIPIIPVLYVLFLVLKVLGLAGIFHYFGARIGRAVNREMSLLGGILLGYLIFSIVLVVPHFFGLVGFLVAMGLGILFWLLFECPAIGLIFLTRAGGQPRTVPEVSMPVAAAATPAAPPPPPSVG